MLGARETDGEQSASPRGHVTYWLLQFLQNAHNAPSTWTSHLASCSSRTGSPTRKHGGFQVKTNKNTYRLHALHLLMPLESCDGSGCICSRGPFCSTWNPPFALGLQGSQWFRGGRWPRSSSSSKGKRFQDNLSEMGFLALFLDLWLGCKTARLWGPSEPWDEKRNRYKLLSPPWTSAGRRRPIFYLLRIKTKELLNYRWCICGPGQGWEAAPKPLGHSHYFHIRLPQILDHREDFQSLNTRRDLHLQPPMYHAAE